MRHVYTTEKKLSDIDQNSWQNISRGVDVVEKFHPEARRPHQSAEHKPQMGHQVPGRLCVKAGTWWREIQLQCGIEEAIRPVEWKKDFIL